jgi:hypothetical protein
VAETVIMNIAGYQTRSVFEWCNITDHRDTQEAECKAKELLAREQEDAAQITAHSRPRNKKSN